MPSNQGQNFAKLLAPIVEKRWKKRVRHFDTGQSDYFHSITEGGKMITKGNHPWNLTNTGEKIVKVCPECNSRKININKCTECGYTPEYLKHTEKITD